MTHRRTWFRGLLVAAAALLIVTAAARAQSTRAIVGDASPILDLNSRHGPSWLRPTNILPGRLLKFAAQLDF